MSAFCYQSPSYIILIILLLLITIILIKKQKQKIKTNIIYSVESYDYLQELSDKYHKKTINSIILGISLIGISIFILLTSNFRPYEIINKFMYNITIYEVTLICIIKNILFNKYLSSIMDNKYEKEYKKQLIKIITFGTIYFIITFLISTLFNKDTRFYILIISVIIYTLTYIYYILKIRKNIVTKNINLNKKRLLIVTLSIIIFSLFTYMNVDSWLLQPYINSIPTVDIKQDTITYNDETGIYTIQTEKQNFKILQLTDIHLGGSSFSLTKDKKALYSVYTLIENTKPDLVIVTGDLVFPVGMMSLSFNNNAPIMEFASFMRNIGVPWAFAYGNHDTEDYAKLTDREVDSLLKSLSYKNSKNLLYPYTQPDITGRNNQIIELRDKNNKLIQALFILDSNSYTGNGLNDYDYIHDDQVEWYENNIKKLNEQEREKVQSLLFFHIPIEEYKIAYELYKQGSNEITYHFGTIGEKNEAICTSNYQSKLFEKAVELESTKGIFCGHDHLNNISLTYKGIRLTYGMSIDYLAYPGIETKKEQRGGTLITIKKDGNFEVDQISLSSILPEESILK